MENEKDLMNQQDLSSGEEEKVVEAQVINDVEPIVNTVNEEVSVFQGEIPKEEKPLNNEVVKEDVSENYFDGEKPKKKANFLVISLIFILIIVGLLAALYTLFYEKSAMFKKAFNYKYNEIQKELVEELRENEGLGLNKLFYNLTVKANVFGNDIDQDLKVGINNKDKELYIKTKKGLEMFVEKEISYIKYKDILVKSPMQENIFKNIEEFDNSLEFDSKKVNKVMEIFQKAFNDKFNKNNVSEKKLKVTLGKHCNGIKSCKEKMKNLRVLTYKLDQKTLIEIRDEFVRLATLDKEVKEYIGEDSLEKMKETTIKEDDETYITFYMDFFEGKMIRLGDKEKGLYIEENNDYISVYYEDQFAFTMDDDDKGEFALTAAGQDFKGKFSYDDNKTKIETEIMGQKIILDIEKTKAKQKIELELDGQLVKGKLKIENDANGKVPSIKKEEAREMKDLKPAELMLLSEGLKDLGSLIAGVSGIIL